MFIARPALHRVLLVGADVMPMETERTMGASALLSDGAFAALVERHARTNRLVALATHASGRGWRGMLGQTEARFLAQYRKRSNNDALVYRCTLMLRVHVDSWHQSV